AKGDGAIPADTKYQLVVQGPERRFTRHTSRNDFVPAAFGGISIAEGVLGQPCVVDTNRKGWLSCMSGTVKDDCCSLNHAWKFKRLKMTVADRQRWIGNGKATGSLGQCQVPCHHGLLDDERASGHACDGRHVPSPFPVQRQHLSGVNRIGAGCGLPL